MLEAAYTDEYDDDKIYNNRQRVQFEKPTYAENVNNNQTHIPTLQSLYNQHHNVNTPDELRALQRNSDNALPCFKMLNTGECGDDKCNYSHNKALVQTAFDKRRIDMMKSPWNKIPTPYPPHAKSDNLRALETTHNNLRSLDNNGPDTYQRHMPSLYRIASNDVDTPRNNHNTHIETARNTKHNTPTPITSYFPGLPRASNTENRVTNIDN